MLDLLCLPGCSYKRYNFLPLSSCSLLKMSTSDVSPSREKEDNSKGEIENQAGGQLNLPTAVPDPSHTELTKDEFATETSRNQPTAAGGMELLCMVDNGTDRTLQRKLPVHVDKLPCGRQPVCHCMPHASHYSSPYHHHSSTRPLSLPLLQPSPTLHTETAHWHRIPHPGHHDTHSTHCHCKTRTCNS